MPKSMWVAPETVTCSWCLTVVRFDYLVWEKHLKETHEGQVVAWLR